VSHSGKLTSESGVTAGAHTIAVLADDFVGVEGFKKGMRLYDAARRTHSSAVAIAPPRIALPIICSAQTLAAAGIDARPGASASTALLGYHLLIR